MKTHFLSVVFGVFSAACPALANPRAVRPLSPSDLGRATTIAAETLLREQGQAWYNTIFASSIRKSPAGDVAQVMLYLSSGGQNRTVTYICHYHTANQIDCHDHQ